MSVSSCSRFGTLPEDVFRHTVEFLVDEDQIKILDCSSTFYRLKKEIRKVKLNEKTLIKCCQDEEYLKKILSLMKNPGRQLNISNDLRKWNAQSFPFKKVSSIKVTYISFLIELLALDQHIRVESAEIKILRSDYNQKTLSSLIPMCEAGFVKSLHFMSFSNLAPFPLSNVQVLKLCHCYDMDVSCFDGIPDLSIINCEDIRGASLLNYNRRIEFSSSHLIDADLSLSESEEIVIPSIKDGLIRLDMSKWKRVKFLDLTIPTSSVDGLILTNNRLPPSVRRFNVSGLFVEKVEWNPFVNQLSELSLFSCESISSLKGLGLDIIPVLRLELLYNLTSLEGLGGRNKKLTIKLCNKVKDFATVKCVDTVRIEKCTGFEDVSQVNEVRDLTLIYTGKLRNLESLTEKTEYLMVVTTPMIFYYPLLTKVPHITFDTPALRDLQAFLSEGGRFENQTITIYLSSFPTNVQIMQDLFQSYFSASYHSIICRSDFMRLIKKL